MADLEGPLLSLRNDLHIAIGRFIDDDGRSDRARRSVLRINNILTGEDVTGSDETVAHVRDASERLAGVKAGQNGKFDGAMGQVEQALSPI